MNNLTAWPGHREAVRGLSFSPDDGRFATCSDDSTIRIWAFEESREERVLTGEQMVALEDCQKQLTDGA
jgi:polyadenylation factor subunit 2